MTQITVDTTAGNIITGKIHRIQRGKKKEFVEEPPQPVKKPARVAILLAVAHKVQHAIDQGDIKNQAEAAQILNITLLAPQIQENCYF